MIYLCERVDGKQQMHPVSMPTFEKAFDVIVCGLGTAGSLAALFCAEDGLSVLGVEAHTCVGGTHTAGGVPGHYFGCPGGRYESLDEKVFAFAKDHTCTTTESRKLVLEQALLEQGVEITFESTVCGVYLQDKTLIGLRILTNGTLCNCSAKLVMDCTAEAHVAVKAGCATEYGRETDGQMQPYSLVSMVFDGQNYRYNNIDFGRVNQNSASALSEAVLFSRSYQMLECNNSMTTIHQMPLLGIREGRRIIPEEPVRLEDLFADKQTQTPMFYSYADLDKHGWDIAFDGETIGDWTIGANLGAYNVTVAVPYKAILPAGFDGILVPCRALGVDRNISSCVRMNPDMKKVAEAAAQWAVLAITQEKPLREISYAQLREKLLQSGCLKESDNRGYRIDGYTDWDGSRLTPRDVHWLTDPAELEAALETEKPGEAIWSAKKMGEKAIPTLQLLLNSPKENTQKHAAFALAILENPQAMPVLRDMVTRRDGLMLKDCRKHNNLRGCMAIYWLGRLGDREIVPELIDLLCNEMECEKEVYHQKEIQTTRYKVHDFEDIYFQFLSQAVMALIRIGEKHADLRPQIAEGFTAAFSSDAYYHRITKKAKNSSEGNMVSALKNISFSAAEKWGTE